MAPAGLFMGREKPDKPRQEVRSGKPRSQNVTAPTGAVDFIISFIFKRFQSASAPIGAVILHLGTFESSEFPKRLLVRRRR
jgi:hypothetical protein